MQIVFLKKMLHCMKIRNTPPSLLKNIVFARIQITYHSEELELENNTFFQEK